MEFRLDSIESVITRMPLFVLVVFRMSGIFFAAPFFSHTAIPVSIKIAFAFFLSLIVFHTVQTDPAELPDNLISFGFLAFKEVAVGAVIGFFGALIFLVFSLAGSTAGRQIGLEMASTLSPGSELGDSLFGFIYYLTALVVFLALNGHHWFIKTLAFSYKVVPLGGFSFMPKLADKMVDSFSIYFSMGIKMAAPFIIIGFLTLIIVGIVLKVTQQTNLFVLELPMKSLVGFTLFFLSAPFIIFFMRNIFGSLQNELVGLLKFLH